MAYVITQPCIGSKDASCVDVCPVDCIHTKDDAEQYFINPAECIDCGVCDEVCPVEGIYLEDAVQQQWARLILTIRDLSEQLIPHSNGTDKHPGAIAPRCLACTEYSTSGTDAVQMPQ